MSQTKQARMSDGLTSLLSYGALSLVRLRNMAGWGREEKKNHLETTGTASVCKSFTEKRLFLTSKRLFKSHRTNMDPLVLSFLLPHQGHAGVSSQQSPGGRQGLHGTHTHTVGTRFQFSVERMCVFLDYERKREPTHTERPELEPRTFWWWPMLLYF